MNSLLESTTISLHHYTLAAEVALYIRVQCREGKADHLRLERLARHFGVSETTLKQLFRQRYQISVHAFVISERVTYICSLLEESNHAVKEIAGMAGYSELSNFSRDFTRVMRVAPTVYRTRFRERKSYQLAESC